MSPKRVVRIEPVERAYLSIPEQAARMRCSETHIRNLLKSGQLEGLRSGRRWLIPVGADERYLKSQR